MVLNNVDETYHNYLKSVLTDERSNFRPAQRTSSATIGTFGKLMEFDVSGESLPVVTTKPVYFKALLPELVAFTRGETDLKFFLDRGSNIWNGNGFDHNRKKLDDSHEFGYWKSLKKDTPEYDQAQAQYISLVKEGKLERELTDLGPIYGAQWRGKNGSSYHKDQLQNLITNLVEKPYSRYHIVSAWNVNDIEFMALPPCHMKFQYYVRKGRDGEMYLDSSLDQRSADSLLGVPFNFTSEALKLHMISNQTGYKPGKFLHMIEDAHIYCGAHERANWYEENFYEFQEELKKAQTPQEYTQLQQQLLSALPEERPGAEGLDHIPYVIEQLSRQESKTPPSLELVGDFNLDSIDVSNFKTTGYSSHKALEIKGKKPKMAI